MINSKSTKSEILTAYWKLDRELKAALANSGRSNSSGDERRERKAVAAKAETPPADLEGIMALLDQLRSASTDAVFSIRSKVSEELVQLKKLVAEIESNKKHLEDVYGVSVSDTDAIGSLVQRYRQEDAEFQAEFNDLKASLSKKRDQADTAMRALVRSRRVAVMEEEKELDDKYKRGIENLSYKLTKRKALDTLQKEDAEKAALEAQERLRQDSENWAAQQRAGVDKRRKAVEAVESELAEKSQKLESSLKDAKESGKVRGDLQASRDLRVLRSELDSSVEKKRIELRALTSESQRNSATLDALKERLEKITADVQVLSQTSLNSHTKGASQALEVAERIALEQARSSNSSSKRS